MSLKQKLITTSTLKQLYMQYSTWTCSSDILTFMISIDSIPLISIRQLMMTGLDAVIMSNTDGYSGWYAFLQKQQRRKTRCRFKMCRETAVKEKSSNLNCCCCWPSMNVVNFFRVRADNDLRPVALWIVVRHQLLKDSLILIVVTAESLHEAPQTALHGYSQSGIFQTDTHTWDQKHSLSASICTIFLLLRCKYMIWIEIFNIWKAEMRTDCMKPCI